MGKSDKVRPKDEVVPLREYVDRILAEMDLRYEQRFEATQERLHSMNEIREQLNEQARTFMPRAEAEQRFKTVEEWRAGEIGADSRGEKSRRMSIEVVSVICTVIIAVAAIVSALLFKK
jgi:hypothetical protein